MYKRQVEDKIEKGMVVAPAGYGAQGQMGANGLPMGGNMSGGTVGGADGPAAGAGTQKPAELPKAIPEDIREVVQNFRAIVRESRPPLKICLGRARLSLGGDNRLLLVFSDAMDAELAGTKEHLKMCIRDRHYGDPAEWLRGDEWDSVMNYDAFMEPVTWFLTGMEKHSDEKRPDLLGNADYFVKTMRHYMSCMQMPSLQVAMNELSNHDHSRFLTRTNQMVGRVGNLGAEAAEKRCV